MIKPYQITGENRYLGLPLGFGFLGATYALSAVIYSQPFLFGKGAMYFQLVVRSFAFIFLCVTYYFSRKIPKNARTFWNITFSALITAIIALFIVLSIPGVSLPSYQLTSTFARFFNLICIVYLCAHTLRSHIEKPNPETIWIPFGYIFFAISQYSLIIFSMDNNVIFAWWVALAIRWAGLAVFLFVSFKSFYCTKKGRLNETNRA